MAQLTPISQVGDTERGSAALARLLQVSPVLRFLDQSSGFEVDATDFDWRPDDASTTVQTRAAGGTYTSSDETPSSKQTGALAFHGDSLDIDISHISDDTLNLRDLGGWIDKRLGRKFTSWGKGIESLIFNGTGAGSPRQMTGLKTIFDGATNLPGYSITGVTDAASALAGAPDSFDLTNSANYDAFLELLQKLIAEVENPAGILCNKELYARLSTIAQKNWIKGESRDQFGKTVVTFDTVPLIKTLDGTITNTEPDNAGVPNTNTTSLWILSPGEERLSLVTNSGLYFEEKLHLESKESGRIEWEMRMEWKVEEKNTGRRLRNIKV